MNICIVNCFDTYEHRVDLLRDAFTSQGHKAIVLASDYKHIDKKRRTEKKNGYIFFHVEAYNKNLSVQRMKSHSHFSRDVTNYIERNIEKIDLIWALIPPNSLVRDLSRIKRNNPKVKLIFDLIDLWPETMPIGKAKSFFPFTYWRDLRNKYLKVADYIVTECNLYRKKLKSFLNGMKVETLYLARPYIEYVPNLHMPDDKISLCYLGSINNIIDIDTIVDIVEQCQKNKPVELHIIGDGENRDSLITKVKATGAEVIYHGKIYSREEKQYILDGCHYGLNIMKDSVCVGLTMKSMDYFEFGLPIINNIHGDTWDIIKRNKCGINYDNHFFLEELSAYNGERRNNARKFFKILLTTDAFNRKLFKIIKIVNI
ncbi:glycosyltransferase [Ruminococcus flavefaciens]|uniref:Glycosyltransferase involved in cell wall bisynthesis n=1 Tax=Ruminococcus flavefaciens TaxID=1265 RepID=A0A1M7G984_RUMFL|nr:glycosyltransferase [Ruminococcus flavefaciens]SHM12964.1 Glycosyltransferase involved in cell wall bisynthesis [Ruminococcus flavefaciens]